MHINSITISLNSLIPSIYTCCGTAGPRLITSTIYTYSYSAVHVHILADYVTLSIRNSLVVLQLRSQGLQREDAYIE